jgi:predicted enzyme related to lactoylglutathione lyase
MAENQATVRYMIDDVAAAMTFYTTHFGFTVENQALPAFAAITRGSLRLLLSGPASSGRKSMPDGRKPVPGGWNRIQIPVADLQSEVNRLRASGIRFINDIVSGVGGSQILLEDPSGNLIELFQPSHTH